MNLSYTAVNLRKNIINNNSNVHIYAADSLSSTIIVYNYIKKDKNADLAIANSISDALDMQLAEELAIAESVTAKELLIARGNISNANILLLIAFIISYRLFADKLNIQQSLLDRVIVVLIIILVDKTQLLLILGDCYLTICAILKHYNFNIYVFLATDTLHLLLKGLLIAVVSLLFVLKAPFTLYFIRAVCDLVILAQYKSYNENTLAYIQGALERINPYSIKLPLSEVAANIAISNFIYAAAVFQSSSKRHNDSKYCNKEVLYLILIIINYTCYDKDRKHIAYIRAFSKVLLFNNNRQINNTTRILSVPFKFYDLSIIIYLVYLVPRDLPNLITHTTMSYYVNNYIN
ncbi:hypothetical protein HBI95_179940 [Parastagonospora nodorum]|nr:hypothetical protein HBI95_179940 [Parastagonospora nodorum]